MEAKEVPSAVTFFEENVRNVHGLDAEGEPCDIDLETEWSGPVHPETGQELKCTCGYDLFDAELREFHPGLFRDLFDPQVDPAGMGS